MDRDERGREWRGKGTKGNLCDVPGVRNEVDLIALEFLLGVAGDGFRVLREEGVSAAKCHDGNIDGGDD